MLTEKSKTDQIAVPLPLTFSLAPVPASFLFAASCDSYNVLVYFPDSDVLQP
jgi:hypothetical protein